MKDRRSWLSLFPLMGVTLVFSLLFPLLPNASPSTLPFSSRALPAEVALVLPSEYGDDAALNLAAGDVRQALAGLGIPLRIGHDDGQLDLAPLNIVVGDQNTKWVRRLVLSSGFTLPQIGEEGYLVQKTGYKEVPFIAVVGGGILGQAYGLFRLAEKLRLDPQALAGDVINLRAEPAMTLRLVSNPILPTYPSPEDALRWGFNAVMVESWPGLALYDGFDPAIYDRKKHPEDRSWVESNRARTRQEIAAAKALHLKVVTMGDVFHLPRQALTLYGSQVSADDNPGLFCIARPKTRSLLAYGLKEVLADFPQIDAVMVRTGENYPLGPLAGNSPAQGSCGGLSYPDRLNQVISVIYKQVVEESGRLYIHRAWDLWDTGAHARPDVARAALKDLQGKPGLMVSFKQTQTDFWRHNPINPNIGGLAGQQMVEFQMAREYEGKGAFPNYLGDIIAKGAPEIEPRGGMEYVYQKGVRAIWAWAKGGGWGGPYPVSDLWIEPNTYALSHLAWDPGLSAESLARDWSTLRFGPKAASAVASMLMKSEAAALQAFYIGAVSKTFGPWTPHDLWLRDDVIYGEPQIGELYNALRDENDFASALAEKEQALETVDAMIADMEGARLLIADQRLAEQAINTLHYERSVAETLGHYLGGMLYYYRWKEGGKVDSDARDEARTRLRDWIRTWEDYETRVVHLEGAATPYSDAGMGQAVLRALTDLEEAN